MRSAVMKGSLEVRKRLEGLGKSLFFEPVLSVDGMVSCSTCHKPELAYTDGRERAVGVGGHKGTRNAPSLVDVGRQRTLFWDGRRQGLEDQALDPLLNAVEHGLASEGQLVSILHADPRY